MWTSKVDVLIIIIIIVEAWKIDFGNNMVQQATVNVN